jgi:cytochrome b involved in lipid metabolism
VNKVFKGGMAAGVGIIGLVLVVPQATYAAAPADHGRSAGYTTAQVAVHHTPADCWTVVKHDVYDLTKWLPLHATAPITAAQICGLDATKAFKTADQAGHHAQSGDHDSDNDRNIVSRDGDKNGGNDGENDGHSANAAMSSSATTHHDDGDNDGPVSLKSSIKSYKIGRLVRAMSPTPTPTVTPTPTPTMTPTPTPTPSPTLATVTGAQLATHNVLTNCWVAISGNVYNLTTFATTHSGGSAVIAPVCGKDGTSVFETRHGVGSSKINTLAQYKVGALVA